jgi:hypothetical protein
VSPQILRGQVIYSFPGESRHWKRVYEMMSASLRPSTEAGTVYGRVKKCD